MRLRVQDIGNKNLVGRNIEKKRNELGMKQKDLLAQLQINGMELNASGLSKIEGQLRSVNDKELVVIAKSLGVTVNWLLGIE